VNIKHEIFDMLANTCRAIFEAFGWGIGLDSQHCICKRALGQLGLS